MSLDPNDNGGYILSWNRGKTVVQAPLDQQVNLPMIRGRPSYTKFHALAAAFKCFPTIIPDDDDDYEESTAYHAEVFFQEPIQEQKTESFTTEPNSKEPQVVINDPITHRDEALFLSWHVKLGHAPFRNIQ